MCFTFNIYSFSSSQVLQSSFSIGYLTFSSRLNLRTKVEYNEYRVSTGEHKFFFLSLQLRLPGKMYIIHKIQGHPWGQL